MKTEIKINKEVKYLSEVISTLPDNCIFDKGKVGCGGTTIALNSEENYVVCVPFTSLIHNKMAQPHKYQVFGVFEGITVGQIKRYLKEGNKSPRKIMVTYDSLPKVIEALGMEVNNFKLLVDEMHILFTSYSYRREAAQSVLNVYDLFCSYCFMTATVVDEEFLLDELKGIDVVTAVWENVLEVRVISARCKNGVDGAVAKTIRQYLVGQMEGNAYFFVNSVEFIKSMVKICGLTEENCRVIYSKNNKTEVGIHNGSTIDTPKKINFCTSTVFEGSDIYDVDGKTYIVSDARREHTLTDISTSFQQIAGRIRNSKYADTIVHIFTTTRYYNDLSYAEFKAVSEAQVNKASGLVNEYNSLSEAARNGIDKVAIESYVVKTNNNFWFDANLVKIDMYNFKVCKSIYKLRVNVDAALLAKGYNVVEIETDVKLDTTKGDKLEKETKNFKDIILELQALLPAEDASDDIMYSITSKAYLFNHELFKEYLVKYPFLEDAIVKLGFEGIEKANYIITNVKKALISRLNVSDEAKVVKRLKLTNKFSNGVFIPSKEAKSILEGIYKEFGITRAAKIGNYYITKEQVKRVDGNLTKGYIIVMPRIVLN